ncbi:hypothetical protein KSP40_PGU010524 [Platanthera guangdongensis]|uniref:Uncharacterized protein n=1 Tax=Platanthera guangdongensis TaxID=2320717 RepID=A0ABR2MRD9_9ASPA
MEKIPPEKIEQLLQNFQNKAMITAQRDLDILYNEGIEMFTKELNITNAKEEQWALLLLQLFKDLHKEEREALNFTNYFADLPPLLKPEGPTPEELVQALKENKKILMDRADRELLMYEKKVKHMFAKVEEVFIKEKRSRFAVAPVDAIILRMIKKVNLECEAGEASNKLDLEDRTP